VSDDFVALLLEVAGSEDAAALQSGSGALPVPTIYQDVEGDLATLFRLAARPGPVLVDFDAGAVHRTEPSGPVSVNAGDGTRVSTGKP
jgi:hypothetical protein